MSEIGDELEIHADIDLEPMMSASNVPREPVESPDEPEEAQNELTETNKDPNQNADDENETDQENVDDEDYIDINDPAEELAIFADVRDEDEIVSR